MKFGMHLAKRLYSTNWDACMYTHMNTNTHTYTHTNTCTHVYTHYTHTCTRKHLCGIKTTVNAEI